MISFVGEEFVQNMMRVVAYIREEVVVHVSSQLGCCGIVAGRMLLPYKVRTAGVRLPVLQVGGHLSISNV